MRITAVEDLLGDDELVVVATGPARSTSTQVDLDGVEFPYDYTVGDGIGDPSPVDSWIVVAELTSAEDEDGAVSPRCASCT